MIRALRAVLLAIPVVAFSIAAQAAEKVVVVPLDNTQFRVQQADFVRLTGEGITGSNITAKVVGPAKIESEAQVVYRKNGHPQIGAFFKEFDIKPSGKGMVTVTITITYPNPPTPKKEIEYKFEVE